MPQFGQAEEHGRGLVASELARIAQEKAAQMSVGDVVEGVVSHCTDFGAFVRIGDGKDLSPVEVLLHHSCLQDRGLELCSSKLSLRLIESSDIAISLWLICEACNHISKF